MALTFTAAANNAVVGSSSTTSCTLPVAVAAGDVVLVVVAGGSAGGAPPASITASDASGDTFTDSGLGSFVGGVGTGLGGIRYQAGAFLTPTVGTTVFTVTLPAANFVTEVYAWKVSGFVGTPTIDKAVKAEGNGTAADSGSSGTLASAIEAAIGFVSVENLSISPGSGWSTGGTNINDGINATSGDIGEHQITAVTTAINATATVVTGEWVAILLTVRDVVGGDVLMPQVWC